MGEVPQDGSAAGAGGGVEAQSQGDVLARVSDHPAGGSGSVPQKPPKAVHTTAAPAPLPPCPTARNYLYNGNTRRLTPGEANGESPVTPLQAGALVAVTGARAGAFVGGKSD